MQKLLLYISRSLPFLFLSLSSGSSSNPFSLSLSLTSQVLFDLFSFSPHFPTISLVGFWNYHSKGGFCNKKTPILRGFFYRKTAIFRGGFVLSFIFFPWNYREFFLQVWCDWLRPQMAQFVTESLIQACCRVLFLSFDGFCGIICFLLFVVLGMDNNRFLSL